MSKQLLHPRVLVVGDLMLDRYTHGRVDRVSPEAPVPILKPIHQDERLGGAASVAGMASDLGCNVSLAGVIGKDPEGTQLLARLDDRGISCDQVRSVADRPTTCKERFVGVTGGAHPQQIVRVDRESVKPIPDEVTQSWLQDIPWNSYDAVIVSDYGKGVATDRFTASLLKQCEPSTLVDPAIGCSLSKYQGADAIKPNRLELGQLAGREIANASTALAACQQLIAGNGLTRLIASLDIEGMVLADASGVQDHFDTDPRTVFDITGAGDTVMATLALAVGSGWPWPESIRLANAAAGIQVEQAGVGRVPRHELMERARINATTNQGVTHVDELG